jgi:P22 coat protein - gene protein 5
MPGNSVLTINMITREAVRLWKNTNAFIQNIDTQYDDSFAKTGAKIGDTLRIRLPNDFTVRVGQAASIQDTAEQSTTLTMATQAGVDVQYSSVDRTLSLDDFSERILAPMINNLAGYVASTVMAGADGGVCNYTANTSGGNVINPIAQTWLTAGAILDQNSCPRGNRKIIMDPVTQANTVASLAGLFNPQRVISEQFETGLMGKDTLGFDWYSDQTVLKHTPGSFTAGTVHGAGQTGLQIVTNAITGTLALGDIITFAGVNAVNRITKTSTGSLRQFVVTAPVANGGTLINIYPALIPFGPGGVEVQYQTVDNSPADAATITLASGTYGTYRKNIAFAPEAVTMATADLVLPKNVEEAARDEFDGVSMRMVSAYNVESDEFITRLDVLFGYLWVRPEWAVVIADTVP